MNTFIGIGKIKDMHPTKKVLKFNLTIHQKRNCIIPCIIFNPTEETNSVIKNLQISKQTVWVKGIVTSKEFQYREMSIHKIEILTYQSSIKPI